MHDPTRSYIDASYSPLINLPVDIHISTDDIHETYAKMLSEELSHDTGQNWDGNKLWRHFQAPMQFPKTLNNNIPKQT